MNRVIRILAVLALAFVFTSPATAIENIHAGVKGGYNISNMSVDPGDELADSRGGLALGGYVGIPVSPMFSVQPEAYFSMKGDSESSGGATGTMKLDYIEVPVLAKASFLPHAKAKPSLFAGPSLAYNLNAKSAIEGTGLLDGETDIKDQTNAVDFGLVFGGGVDYSLQNGAKSIGIDLRYTMGLTNTIDSDTGAEAKNHVFSIMGTLGFL
jgi:hypothetical protein